MEIKKGIPVSPGVAICKAVVLDAEDVLVPRRVVARSDVVHQHQRLEEALVKARHDVQTLRDNVERSKGTELAKIFDFHLFLLYDRSLIDPIHQLIAEQAVTAEFALTTVINEHARKFNELTEALFRERAADLYDVEKRVLRHLIADVRSELEHLHEDAVVVARDLSPSQTASLDRRHVMAMATDAGGRTSHTAIVARALGIPAVVGLEDATVAVSTGDVVIVDGNHGLLIINPDAEQLAEYEQFLHAYRQSLVTLGGLAQLPAETRDGVKVSLQANIEFADEIPEALKLGATGVGLYRTEFLFLSTEREPNEQEQYEAFSDAIRRLGDRPMTIRTLDLGADKYTQARATMPERNPFLGCRSIRFCLQNLQMFKPHLRAILRASVHGRIRIMFPLITNMMELRQARMVLNDVMEDLEEEAVGFDRNAPVGMMIEVPSAALMARSFAAEVDFFSIGTNDLVQYTLAVDRGNEHVASLYSPAHPAVVALLKNVLRAAKRARRDVSCCGEMAGEPEFIMLLLGLGLRSLSMTPRAIPLVKQVVRAVTIEQCEKVARRVISYDSERQILNYLREETRKAIPEAADGRAIV